MSLVFAGICSHAPGITGQADMAAEQLREPLYAAFRNLQAQLAAARPDAVIVVAAVWTLALKVLFGLVLSNTIDPTDPAVFQGVFGMIFTVIIALEFKRSLLIVTERSQTVVQARAVVLIAILAVVRKLIILDFATTDAAELLALAAATLSLGAVHWLVRDQDRREHS